MSSCSTRDLQQVIDGFFGGSERRFRHPLVRNFIMTEGAYAVAETAGAHWLMDIIATEMHPVYRKAWIQGQASIGLVRLVVKDLKATLAFELEDGVAPAVTKELDFTDFPEGEWIFYMGTDELGPEEYVSTLMVPPEY